MDKRIITQREEEAYRLCHLDFDGLPVDQAAKQMGITRDAIMELLKNVERKAPQLTPVLTPRQQLILILAGDKGQTPEQIATSTELSASYVRGVVGYLEAHGFVMPKLKMQNYTPRTDGRVVERF